MCEAFDVQSDSLCTIWLRGAMHIQNVWQTSLACCIGANPVQMLSLSVGLLQKKEEMELN
jgi:hypothetical protein